MFSFSFVIWNFHDKKKFVKWARTLCGKTERKWTQEFLVMHTYLLEFFSKTINVIELIDYNFLLLF